MRARGECALIPFVTAGDPDLGVTEALVPALVEAGADAVEIGVRCARPTVTMIAHVPKSVAAVQLSQSHLIERVEVIHILE